MGLPVEFYVALGICVALMAFSAWYLGDDDKRVRALARVGIVLGGTGTFVVTMYYVAILGAVLLIMVPVALIAAWWNGLF